MRKSAPRRGIERRILASILWVGILPLALALVVGSITARESQGRAVQSSLLITAKTTAAGLRLACFERLRNIRVASTEPAIVDALRRQGSGALALFEDSEVRGDLESFFQHQERGESAKTLPSVFRLYDGTAKLVHATAEQSLWLDTTPERLALLTEPTLLDLEYDPASSRYLALGAAPVNDPVDGQILGYVTEMFDASRMVRYALGYDPDKGSAPSGNVHQFFYRNVDGEFVVAHLDQYSDPVKPRLIAQPLDRRLTKHLGGTIHRSSDSMELFNYQVGDRKEHVLLAYDRLFDWAELYICVYRPAWEVFASIYKATGLALAACGVGIAFLCLNAYRNVHNNIVRPVMLLNEGAQIIGAGDLELKLKIGTGDEIEELAQSFNKMALALKANIHQLEESEERYRSLVTSMRDGIYQVDLGGIARFLNPAGAEVFGFNTVEQALGQNVQHFFLNQRDVRRMRAALTRDGFIERTRMHMKRRDGRAITVELSGNLMYGDNGAVAGMEGIFRDVTESVRLERAARERAERLSAISQIANVINSSLEAGRLYDSLVVEVKKLIDFDYAELALLDEQGETFKGRQLWPEQRMLRSEYPLDDQTSCAAWVARQQQVLVVDDFHASDVAFSDHLTQEARSAACVPLYASGRIIGTINLTSRKPRAYSAHDLEVLEQIAPHVAVAIRNAQLLENLQSSLEEVTRAREKLYEANEELKTLDEMKTNLLSNVSHELRTPLVAVMGYTDMIYNGKVGPVNEMQKEYLKIGLRNIEKLVTLIENLLDFSRLHRGAETLVFDTLDLTDCARSSLQIVKPVADAREIELILDAPGDEVLVDGDKGKLGQVFNNLLSNAVKFNTKGGKVTLTISCQEDSVEASVTDTGIGIPEEALDKVFTRFYQYDSSSTRKYGGTGIGLSIAQDIARLHGSRITVTSEVGKGTTFRFSLPRHFSRDMAQTVQDGTARHAALPGDTRMLVELVTQDRALVNQVRSLLGAEGMDVIHAAEPARAVPLAQRYRPDCVILDVETDPDAVTLADDLTQVPETQSTRIILLTGDDALYGQYRDRVSSRLKRGFRKSTLLSSIQYAVHEEHPPAAELGKKILCVDDDPEVLTFMRRCIENGGYETTGCQSGDEAVRLAATKEYGVVLLDIAMPGMDGWEACRHIRSNPELAGIRVYMVTAKPIDAGTSQTQRANADGYLTKPFKAEDLVELVKAHETLNAVSGG